MSDGSALAHAWPAMSARAALIARTLSVVTLSTWLAFSAPHLMVLLAFVVPFWIAMELEVRQQKRQRVSRARMLRISFTG